MKRRGYWAVRIALSIGLCALGVLPAFGLFNSQGIPFGKGFSVVHAGTSLSAPLTLEPRAYLPIVMANFCTPVSIPADAKLFGVVFFDYNGDGLQQENEPGIIGASVSAGSESTSSQCQGVYYFHNLPDGIYNLTVTAPGFRYLSASRSDFKPAGTPLQVQVNGRTKQDVGLMQGFLTLPYHRATTFNIGEYFDYDPEYYKYLWWNGQRGYGIRRNHVGTDLGVSENGIPVVAPAPGKIIGVVIDPNGGWGIDARAPDGTIWGIFHITPTVSLEQTVGRGDLIGYVNFPGSPHVHLDVKVIKPDGHWYARDSTCPLMLISAANGASWMGANPNM
jgi:hypothetical protein